MKGLISENEEKILLYCPTWRGEDLNNPDINIESILNEAKELEAHLNYKVLVKVHPFIYEEAKKDCDLKNYLIPDYVDTNELLAIVDLMVTDYSSIFFDYLVTNKPIIFILLIMMTISSVGECILIQMNCLVPFAPILTMSFLQSIIKVMKIIKLKIIMKNLKRLM